MITEKDLQEAIAECQGVRNPNANTAIKLAAFLIIQKELYPQDRQHENTKSIEYSYEAPPVEEVTYQGESDFARAVMGIPTNKVLAVMDEAMSTLHAVMPRLYNGIMRQLAEQ